MAGALAFIWIIAAAAAAFGYAAARWRRQAGWLYMLAIACALVWHLSTLATPWALVLLLTPSAGILLGSIAAGYLLVFAATLGTLMRRRHFPAADHVTAGVR